MSFLSFIILRERNNPSNHEPFHGEQTIDNNIPQNYANNSIGNNNGSNPNTFLANNDRNFCGLETHIDITLNPFL
jgi:hypothetical protein